MNNQTMPPPTAQQPKLTPEKLQQFRSEGIQPSTIVKFYGGLNPEFKQKYDAGSAQGLSFSDSSGKPISWDDAALNMEAYGNPAGEMGMQQAQSPAPRGGGIVHGIGSAASSIWDYATAPIDAAAGTIEYGMAKGLGAIGFSGAEKKQMQNNPDITGLKGNFQQTADILPVAGAMVGSAAGPVGTGAGAFAGKAVGNLIETGIDMANGNPQRRGAIGKIAGPVVEGALNYAGDKAFTAAADLGMPLFKKGLMKMGGVLTNVSDQVLERAFNQPRIMSTAIKEISDNVSQPFLKLSQQIGNTMKAKIEDAGAAIGKAKDFILKNNPGAKYDVSGATSAIRDVLKSENLSLEKAPGKLGKDFFLLNTSGDAMSSGGGVITGVGQGQAKPFTKAELAGITEYIQTIAKADSYSIDDVLDLKKLYNRIYKEIGTNDIGTTSNAQRVLRKLRTTVDSKISEVMPANLKAAYSDFSSAMGAYEDFGHFLTENRGKLELSDRGESFLNTLWGNTKGQRREDVNSLSEFLGIDISGKMQLLKDAQELSAMFPKTGSRTLDILRSFLSKSAATAGVTTGAVTGGVPGAILGGVAGAGMTAATSPVVVGKAAMTAGSITGSRTFKGIVGQLSKLAPAERQALIMMIGGAGQAIDKSISPDQPGNQQQSTGSSQ